MDLGFISMPPDQFAHIITMTFKVSFLEIRKSAVLLAITAIQRLSFAY